jgi:hypothetical protein
MTLLAPLPVPGSQPHVGFKHALLALLCGERSAPFLNAMLLFLQFERFCRPYYATGFNAYELVETAMVSKRAETIGKPFLDLQEWADPW